MLKSWQILDIKHVHFSFKTEVSSGLLSPNLSASVAVGELYSGSHAQATPADLAECSGAGGGSRQSSG